jgi:hypothetical protein
MLVSRETLIANFRSVKFYLCHGFARSEPGKRIAVVVEVNNAESAAGEQFKKAEAIAGDGYCVHASENLTGSDLDVVLADRENLVGRALDAAALHCLFEAERKRRRLAASATNPQLTAGRDSERPRRHRWRDTDSLGSSSRCIQCGITRSNWGEGRSYRDPRSDRVWYQAPPCPPPAEGA